MALTTAIIKENLALVSSLLFSSLLSKKRLGRPRDALSLSLFFSLSLPPRWMDGWMAFRRHFSPPPFFSPTLLLICLAKGNHRRVLSRGRRSVVDNRG